jgi:hypothetical protein
MLDIQTSHQPEGSENQLTTADERPIALKTEECHDDRTSPDPNDAIANAPCPATGGRPDGARVD